MPIITLATAKTLLQISDTSKDTLINTIIPRMQDWVVDYCNNPFHVTSKKLTGTTFAFADDDPDIITDSDSGFVDAGFVDGNDVDVEGSVDNDGIYLVDTVAAGTLTLSSNEELVAEDAGASVVITRVRFPEGLELPAAKLIGWDIQQANMYGISEKSLGDFRVKYGSGGGGEKDGSYPNGLLIDFNPYRKISRVKVSSYLCMGDTTVCKCGSCCEVRRYS